MKFIVSDLARRRIHSCPQSLAFVSETQKGISNVDFEIARSQTGSGTPGGC
jgi:hypothetical protein